MSNKANNDEMKNLDDEFVNLVQAHRSTIYAVCYMFSDEQLDVEDLFQEVLLRLWKGFKSFQGRSDIKTWIYRVSLNCCINAKRQSNVDKGKTKLDFDVPDFDAREEKNMQVDLLYKRINKLGYFDRAIIMLWLEGLRYDEIAEIVGISVKNVSWRLVQIKNQLKNN